MGNLSFLGSPVLGGVRLQQHRGNSVYICGVSIKPDETLELHFPKGHPLYPQAKLTVHLDNRTGVDEYDASLRLSHRVQRPSEFYRRQYGVFLCRAILSWFTVIKWCTALTPAITSTRRMTAPICLLPLHP